MTVASSGYLASPAFSRLWTSARDAWERNGGLTGNAVVNNLNESEAIEISGLLGRRRPFRAGANVRVPLAELDEALSEFATPLEEWLEETGGKLVDRRQVRADAVAARAELWHNVEARAAEVSVDLSTAIEDLRRTGLARRLGERNERELLQRSLDVVERVLESEQPLDIAVLAAETCGDAKGLNNGRPLGTLVTRVLAILAETATPTAKEDRRLLWERYGVLCDSLSSTALTLNLRIRGSGPLASSLELSAECGEPRVLTLRELSRTVDAVITNRDIYICENPTVVSAAAAKLGPRGAALLCVEGWPSVAMQRLLDLAARCGGAFKCHGDFDWNGLRIIDRLVTRYGAQPWRMSSSDYISALEIGAETRSLTGPPHEPSWDLELAPAMRGNLKVVEEEGAVLTGLLADLAS
jgi:uncharacterized protein (TIGR02679 family)